MHTTGTEEQRQDEKEHPTHRPKARLDSGGGRRVENGRAPRGPGRIQAGRHQGPVYLCPFGPSNPAGPTKGAANTSINFVGCPTLGPADLAPTPRFFPRVTGSRAANGSPGSNEVEYSLVRHKDRITLVLFSLAMATFTIGWTTVNPLPAATADGLFSPYATVEVCGRTAWRSIPEAGPLVRRSWSDGTKSLGY